MSMQETKSESRQNEIFGSFYLSDSEFALAVTFIQEVVNAPTAFTPVPLAPPFLKGLFNLRGTVIPVIDLKELLGLSKSSSPETQKIAVVELENCCVGLLFDKTGEVFKSLDEEKSLFETQGVVSGVFKKDLGKRIVQIIDVSKLFRLQNIPKDSSRSRLERANLGRKRGSKKQCISFVVGPAKCALPISDIQEILKISKLSESALGTGFCIGTIDLRGSTVPVIDFPALLKYRQVDQTESATHGDRRVVVMRLESELFGLLVDSVDSIVSFFPDELLKFPIVEQRRGEMFVGCITGYDAHDILLLDHLKILENAEINDITRGHSKIYQSRSQSKNDESTQNGHRRTYITFRIDGSYAVPIGDVKEVIEYPMSLLQPPGLKKHVKGVLKLRNDLVTIIDARSLYITSMAERPNQEPPKVLVFSKNGVHFGLIVDCVEAIVSFNDRDKVKLPPLLYQQGEGSMSADVTEAVEVTDTNGTKRSLLIISADAISNRAAQSIAA